jgi:hypothetical protein
MNESSKTLTKTPHKCNHYWQRFKTPEQKFFEKVDKTTPLNGCWIWTGEKGHCGYGRWQLGDIKHYTHRLSWEWHNGPIPAGMHVLHHCDNPPCCNPAHLFLGKPKDNAIDKSRKGRARKKLTATQVLEIRKRWDAGETQNAIAFDYSVTQAAISAIVLNVVWRDVYHVT